MKSRVLPFKMTQRIGHFGTLTHCVVLLKACFGRGVEPFFFVANELWQKHGLGENAFSYYFRHRRLSKSQAQRACRSVAQGKCEIVADRYDINLFAHGDRKREVMNDLRGIDEGRELFERHVVISPRIRAIANAFYARNLAFGPVLGIHYRGHDKQIDETDLIEFRRIYEVTKIKMRNGFKRIFLATDDESFYGRMISSDLGSSVITWCGSNQRLPHYQDCEDNFRKGANALVDALLLARCQLVIKTPSLLSAWSKVFNPSLPMVLVGRPFPPAFYGETELRGYGYWPERCLWEDSDWRRQQQRSGFLTEELE